MEKIIRISLAMFFLLCIVNCKSVPLPAENEEIITTDAQVIISPEALDEQTPEHRWKQFFVQRDAHSFWEILQQRLNQIEFYFQDIMYPLAGIDQPANELAAGIIEYIVDSHLPVQNLAFLGVRQNAIMSLSACTHPMSLLPASIGDLTALTSLSIYGHQLQALPSEISQLTSLQRLDLSFNKLKKVPSEISTLVNLRTLSLYNNQIKAIPAEVGNLTQLQSLILYDNQLKKLPLTLGQLTKLSMLDLSGNLLKILPEQIGNLIKLTTLDLSGNRIAHLPSSIRNLSGLEELHLNNNRLTAMPAVIVEFPNLYYLNICDNNIKVLPASLYNQLNNLLLEHIEIDEDQNALQDNELELAGILGNNPWLDASQLIPLDIAIVRHALQKHLQQKLPYSLLILCMQVIESNIERYDLAQTEEALPNNVCQIGRKIKLFEAYRWNAGKNIIFFKRIGSRHFPFHLDCPVSTYQAMDNILGELADKKLYHIPAPVSSMAS
jgi:Leucine-rich repeat (LRR) protein